jgi:predicted acyltransferase
MAINSFTVKKPAERLASLDILRGFDLFMLVFFQPVFVELVRHWEHIPFFGFLLRQFEHKAWTGFSAWDLVMPLFLFMVGAAMPFSFEKFKSSPDKKAIYKKIIRRFIILFILGMIVQGNLLSLDPLQIRLYSNTLQAIAVGYLIAAVFQLHLSNKFQYIATALLLIGYWALLTFFGDFTPEGNFAEKVDQLVLARFRDGVSYQADGTWQFNPNYRYTWILSSMTFGVTVMLGVFAGKIMKNGTDKRKNSMLLLIWGVALIVAGGLLSFQTPIIKKIWSSSMTLYSGGLCFLLMALFYYMIDYRKKSKGMNWLKIYGMNSITAYTLGMVINFRSVANSVLWGFEKYIGDFYPALLTFANFLILFFILRLMYKAKVFVKI